MYVKFSSTTNDLEYADFSTSETGTSCLTNANYMYLSLSNIVSTNLWSNIDSTRLLLLSLNDTIKWQSRIVFHLLLYQQKWKVKGIPICTSSFFANISMLFYSINIFASASVKWLDLTL